MFELQLLYKNSRRGPVPAGPSSLIAECSPLVRELESQIVGKEAKCVAAFSVADASRRDLDAPQV